MSSKWSRALEEVGLAAKTAATHVMNASGMGGAYGGGFDDTNGGMHRFVNEGVMRNKAFGGFKSSGTFEGFAVSPSGGFMPAFAGGGGGGGFAAAIPGGMLTNYSLSSKLAAKALREAFEEHTDEHGRWTGGVTSTGYPKMRDGDKIRLASHVALELAGRGPVPDDKVVAHNDNDKRNLKPGNLRITTQKANLQQAEDEGRWRPRGPNKPDR